MSEINCFRCKERFKETTKVRFLAGQYYCGYCAIIYDLEEQLTFKTKEVEALEQFNSEDSIQTHISKIYEMITNMLPWFPKFDEKIRFIAGEIKHDRVRLRRLEKTLNTKKLS